MRCSAPLLLLLLLPTAMMALVPHQFWNRPNAMRIKLSPNARQSQSPIGACALSMYFDDRERLLDIEERWRKPIFGEKKNPWIISLSEEKRLAVEKFLGYNPKSASKLTNEQVEEETLRWVVDTDIVSVSSTDSNENDPQATTTTDRQRGTTTAIKYDSIKDLLVASSCNSTLQSLTFLWNGIADALEDEMSQPVSSPSSSSNSVKLIVFPKSKSLWNYDTIVTMLEAIQIARPLLPTKFDIRLDLFHPDFKHSPRMWSPQWHSPFPTVGISIIKEKKQPSSDEIDIDMDTVRAKLDALFQSVDATREDAQNSNEDHLQILEDCRSWLQVEHERKKARKAEAEKAFRETYDVDENNNIDWTVQTRGSPFQLYRTLWNSILTLSSVSSHKSASVVIDPFLDSCTLHRVAVTVNAALKRLDIPIRITEVYHPFARPPSSNSSCETRPPYGMIQLSPLRK